MRNPQHFPGVNDAAAAPNPIPTATATPTPDASTTTVVPDTTTTDPPNDKASAPPSIDPEEKRELMQALNQALSKNQEPVKCDAICTLQRWGWVLVLFSIATMGFAAAVAFLRGDLQEC